MVFIVKFFLIWMLLVAGCGPQNLRVSNGCRAPSRYTRLSNSDIIKHSRKLIQPKSSDRRAIAFSLYGRKKIYNEGLIENLKLAKEYYPGWEVVVYIDPITTPAATIDEARSLGAIVLKDRKFRDPASRFLIADLDYDLFISRDVDSRPTWREIAAVADFIENDWAILHGMRDFRGQNDPLQAGLWGARTIPLRERLRSRHGTGSMQELYQQFSSKKKKKKIKYGDDQKFLAEFVVPAVGEEAFLSHESYQCNAFLNSRGFPIPRGVGIDFIGARID